MTNVQKSTPVSEFEAIYRDNADPWAYTWLRAIRTAFSSRLYERRKYWWTTRIIPRQRYRKALEIGCSVGVFTKILGRQCDDLMAIDYSPTALAYARKRCAKCSQIRFVEASVPEGFPTEQFELIVFSEVAYYLSESDFISTGKKILAQLAPAGYLVMVHYRHHRGLPSSGDFAHDWFLARKTELTHLKDWRRASAYRMDLFQSKRGQTVTGNPGASWVVSGALFEK